MATQGQRRAEALRAVRQLRRLYRIADSRGESVERELDRLLKRKTLIGPQELKTLMDRINVYLGTMDTLQNGAVTLFEIITALPR